MSSFYAIYLTFLAIVTLTVAAPWGDIERPLKFPPWNNMAVGNGEPYCHNLLTGARSFISCRASFLLSRSTETEVVIYDSNCLTIGSTGNLNDTVQFTVDTGLKYPVYGDFNEKKIFYGVSLFTPSTRGIFTKWYWGNATNDTLVFEMEFDCGFERVHGNLEAIDHTSTAKNSKILERTDNLLSNFHAAQLAKHVNIPPDWSPVRTRNGEPYCSREYSASFYCHVSFVESLIGLGNHMFVYGGQCELLGRRDVDNIDVAFDIYSMLPYSIVVTDFHGYNFSYAGTDYGLLLNNMWSTWYWADSQRNSHVIEVIFDCNTGRKRDASGSETLSNFIVDSFDEPVITGAMISTEQVEQQATTEAGFTVKKRAWYPSDWNQAPVGSGEPYCHPALPGSSVPAGYCRVSFVESLMGLGNHIFVYGGSCKLLGHKEISNPTSRTDVYSQLPFSVVLTAFSAYGFWYAGQYWGLSREDQFSSWYWGDAGKNSHVYEVMFDCSKIS